MINFEIAQYLQGTAADFVKEVCSCRERYEFFSFKEESLFISWNARHFDYMLCFPQIFLSHQIKG